MRSPITRRSKIGNGTRKLSVIRSNRSITWSKHHAMVRPLPRSVHRFRTGQPIPMAIAARTSWPGLSGGKIGCERCSRTRFMPNSRPNANNSLDCRTGGDSLHLAIPVCVNYLIKSGSAFGSAPFFCPNFVHVLFFFFLAIYPGRDQSGDHIYIQRSEW